MRSRNKSLKRRINRKGRVLRVQKHWPVSEEIESTEGACKLFFVQGRTTLYFGSRLRAHLFNLPSFTPPVRATVGEVRYSIEIDVGGE